LSKRMVSLSVSTVLLVAIKRAIAIAVVAIVLVLSNAYSRGCFNDAIDI
jgi:hypothetical protein